MSKKRYEPSSAQNFITRYKKAELTRMEQEGLGAYSIGDFWRMITRSKSRKSNLEMDVFIVTPPPPRISTISITRLEFDLAVAEANVKAVDFAKGRGGRRPQYREECLAKVLQNLIGSK